MRAVQLSVSCFCMLTAVVMHVSTTTTYRNVDELLATDPDDVCDAINTARQLQVLQYDVGELTRLHRETLDRLDEKRANGAHEGLLPGQHTPQQTNDDVINPANRRGGGDVTEMLQAMQRQVWQLAELQLTTLARLGIKPAVLTTADATNQTTARQTQTHPTTSRTTETDFSATASTHANIRLTGSSMSNEGRLEIYHNGVWGTVCDNKFDDVDASVVCFMLGYGRSGQFKSREFGSGSGGNSFDEDSRGSGSGLNWSDEDDTQEPVIGKIWLDEVECRGSELSLAECQHSSWGVNNCQHDQDVFISCNQLRTSLPLATSTNRHVARLADP